MAFKFINELARKTIHLMSLVLIVLFFILEKNFGKEKALLSLLFILIIFMILEYIRIETNKTIPVLSHIWSFVRRKKEKNKLGGDIFLIIGLIIALSLFDIKVAIAAILMTTLGDLSAALVGKRFRKYPLKTLRERSWEGILTELFVNIIIGVTIFIIFSSTPNAILIIFAMSLTATIIETIIYKVDDNLYIPLFSGFIGQVILMLS